MARSLFPILIILLAISFGVYSVGGVVPKMSDKNTTLIEDQELYFDHRSGKARDTIQLETFGLRSCGSNAAVNLLIDNSGSMAYGSKMQNLKTALKTLADNFPDSGVLTLQTYSVYPVELVPFEDLFGKARPRFLQAVNSMAPIEATHSKDGFLFAKAKLDAGRPKFPKHKFAMVFISDGIPEDGPTNNRCPGGISGPICGQHPQGFKGACRCFSASQDPRTVATEVKKSGVRIFTISYVDDSDQKFNKLLTNMMTEVASSPSDAYLAPSSDKVLDILKQIKVKLCGE